MRALFLGAIVLIALPLNAQAQSVSVEKQCAAEWPQIKQMDPQATWPLFLKECKERLSAGQSPIQQETSIRSQSGHPNDADVTQCVQSFINRSIQMGPAVMQCQTFVQFEGAKVIDSKPNGGDTDAIVEITLRVAQNISGQSMAASMCTGTGWGGDLIQGQWIVLTKVMSFQVFSTQAICQTRALAPIVKGNSFNN